MIGLMTQTLAAAASPASGIHSTFYLIIFVVALALVFDFLNGFHDAANSVATIVATRILSPTTAVIWAALFNFAAAFVFGTKVAKTIGEGMIDTSQVDVFVVFGGLIGAIIWNLVTWYLALPTSSSHAIIGGYAGAAVAKGGMGVLILAGWNKIILFIFLSPIVGFVLGAINMICLSWLFRRSSPDKVEKMFRPLRLLSAGAYSLAHGSNDAQKTMGIIVALLIAGNHKEWAEGGFHMMGHQHDVSLWIILSCYAAISLGTLCGGRRIMKTMGTGITRLQTAGAFSAELAAALTISYASLRGTPLSTTHAITGSILGVGTTKGIRSVRWIWGQRIIMAWILTIPCSAFMAAVAYLLVHWCIQPLFH